MVASATSVRDPDFVIAPSGRRFFGQTWPHDTRRASRRRSRAPAAPALRIATGGRGRARLHDHRLRERLRESSSCATRPSMFAAELLWDGRPESSTCAGFEGPRLCSPGRTRAICASAARIVAVVAAARSPPALAPLLMNLASPSSVTAGRRRVHRQRPAAHGGPRPADPAGARHRLRPDAGRAGPVVAPRLPPVEPAFFLLARVLADALVRGRCWPDLSRGCEPPPPTARLDVGRVLDPVRAALSVAPPASSAWRPGSSSPAPTVQLARPVHLAPHAERATMTIADAIAVFARGSSSSRCSATGSPGC